MTFLLGRQAMLGQDPPMYLRSMTATRCPSPAKVQAAMVDPVPPPRITRSNSSGRVMLSAWDEETFVVVMGLVLSQRLARFQFRISRDWRRHRNSSLEIFVDTEINTKVFQTKGLRGV